MTLETRLELQRLLSALCDRELTDGQYARLEELLDTDPECRRVYLEYLDMHAGLLAYPHLVAGRTRPLRGGHEYTLAGSATNDTPVSPNGKRSDRGRRKVLPALNYALVAVGTLAASLLVQGVLFPPRTPDGDRPGTPDATGAQAPQYVATLVQTADCAWESAGGARRAGSRLPPGELRLRKGIARLHFDGGPNLVIEGPAVLRIESGAAATVLRGKVVFRGDETAAPFDLHTPSSTLVDFGTEYAVVVGPEGEEVHVFAGKVRRTPLTGAGQAEPEQLTAGEARHYGPAPASLGQPVPPDPARFKRQVESPGGPPPDPADGLLAYEGFDYRDTAVLAAGQANGGFGWSSSWTPGFARP